MTELIVRTYRTRDGRRPFREWLDTLRDGAALDRIETRLARLRNGNLGDHRMLEGGIFELRIFHGPGYRIYGARQGAAFVLLLCGGDKTRQQKDIVRARAYWADYQTRHDAD